MFDVSDNEGMQYNNQVVPTQTHVVLQFTVAQRIVGEASVRLELLT